MMMTRAILWPTFALVALDGEAMRAYFRPVERPAANLANLFEMPVLYFALVPLLLATGLATLPQVTLPSGYVALRAVHSITHIAGRVRPRFALFLASHAVLAAMWVGFAIDIGFSAR